MKLNSIMILILMVLSTSAIMAQKTDIQPAPSDKKKIELRPNSRDYGPVIRDNFHKRQVLPRDKSILLKTKLSKKDKMMKPGKSHGLKKDQQQRRRQILLQRRNIRR